MCIYFFHKIEIISFFFLFLKTYQTTGVKEPIPKDYILKDLICIIFVREKKRKGKILEIEDRLNVARNWAGHTRRKWVQL